jgi:hypothetical protein
MQILKRAVARLMISQWLIAVVIGLSEWLKTELQKQRQLH